MNTTEAHNSIRNPMKSRFVAAITLIAVSSLYLKINKAEPIPTSPAEFYKDTSRTEVYQRGRRAVFNVSAVGLSVELTYCKGTDLAREQLGFWASDIRVAENYLDCVDGHLSEAESLKFRPVYDAQP